MVDRIYVEVDPLMQNISGLPGVVAASGTVPAYLTITTSNWLELARNLES